MIPELIDGMGPLPLKCLYTRVVHVSTLWHKENWVFFRIFPNLLQRPLKGTTICLFWRKIKSPDNGFIDNADYHLCWMMDLVFSWKWTTLKQQFKNHILFGNVYFVGSPPPRTHLLALSTEHCQTAWTSQCVGGKENVDTVKMPPAWISFYEIRI